jgi:hypothetical protein
MSAVRSISAFIVTATLVVGSGAPARAGVPNPTTSSVDPCVRVCPAGDMAFRVTVRDAIGNPVPNSSVLVDFAACLGFTLCPLLGSEPYTMAGPTAIMMTSDGSGVVDIPIRAGGSCQGAIHVFADGVQLGSRGANTSPDQNGDLTVDATDQALLALKLGGPFDPNADLNCSAALGPGDATVQNAHLGHSCAAVVPVLPSSWGRIKTIYR